MGFSRLSALIGSADSLRGQLVRGGTGSAFVQVASRLVALALGIVLARGLGAQGYGIYAYAMALMTLLMVLAELGMPYLLVREVAASEARQDWSYLRGVISRSLQFVLVAAVALAAVAALFLWQLSGAMSASQSRTLFLVLLLLPVAASTNAALAALRGLRHVVKSQVMQMLIRPSLVLFSVGGIFILAPDMRLPQHVMAVQVGAAVATLCVALFLLFRYLPAPVRTTPAVYQTYPWLRSALPFTLLAGAGLINSQTDIIMLGMFRPPEDVGIYRVAVQGAGMVIFGLQAVNAVIAPQFARMYAQGDMARLQRLATVSARLSLVVALPITLVFVVAGGSIAAWIFGPEFLRAHTPLALLAIGQLMNAAMGSVGFLLTMSGHERVAARFMLMTGLLNIMMNLALIPPFGMAGAAVATAISLALWNVLLYRAVTVRTGIRSTAFSLTK